jgi:hypothetical protein
MRYVCFIRHQATGCSVNYGSCLNILVDRHYIYIVVVDGIFYIVMHIIIVLSRSAFE